MESGLFPSVLAPDVLFLSDDVCAVPCSSAFAWEPLPQLPRLYRACPKNAWDLSDYWGDSVVLDHDGFI